ncbi:MYCBP-associated protein isoform X10 [Macaca fascicularis]|uniref:MYCBP-associated protein isoform X10 n=1 Tax=Macaca fascicularis TaxID=9541 RepID=UPI003D153F7E
MKKVVSKQSPPKLIGRCPPRAGRRLLRTQWRPLAGWRARGRRGGGAASVSRGRAVQGHAHRRDGTMKSLKKDSRLKITPARLLEAAESFKEKKRAKGPEQPTPPIQEEPEPVSNVLQGDDILALAIKKEDLKEQHIPRLTEKEDKRVITQKFIIRKLKPTDPRRKVCHLVARPANPDAATKPLDYSGPGDSFDGSDQILPHHILGSLQDFKRIALARGNTRLAELIPTSPCLMTLISAKGESKQKAPKEEKRPPWAPPPQHNFLKNWQRNIALRKKQQEALSEHLKKPISELLMHTGETYRRIQEERELIDCTLPTRRDRKSWENSGFWSRLEYLGDEMTGLVMTKTKTQRGLMEPITHIGKPHSIRVETGLPAQRDASYRYTWDRSLFLIYRRKELQKIMAELDFSQQRQVGIAVHLTFETLEGEKTSSELTVVNNGTVAIWYDWRRQHQPDTFQDLKKNRMQRFYFNSREGVILPGETKTFTFFFKSLTAGIFREFWEFRTHPTLLGGAVLQVNLHAVSLTQDVFEDERKVLESKLMAHEAVTIVHEVLQEVLMGVLTPERTPSPVDAYLTKEDLFWHRNPQLHYEHQVVQSLHELWRQYMTLPPNAEEARPGDKEHVSPIATEKASVNAELLPRFRSPTISEPQVPQPENEALRESGSQKARVGTKSPQQKSIMEEILVEESPDVDSAKSPWEPDGLPLLEWNLCLEDFRKAVMVLPDENQREDALMRLNKAALELCQKPRPLQSNLLHQMGLQLWRDVIDSLVSHSLWLRSLLGLPEKETIYLNVPEEQDQKSPAIMEVKVPVGKVGKEERKGAAQEKKQLGIKDKEDKKGARQDRPNSKKHRAKDDKKVIKSTSRDRFSLEDPMPDINLPSQEPIDPLVMEKYTQRLHSEVKGSTQQPFPRLPPASFILFSLQTISAHSIMVEAELLQEGHPRV